MLNEIRTSDDESESVSSPSLSTVGGDGAGGFVWLNPAAAEVTSMCHLVATDAIA